MENIDFYATTDLYLSVVLCEKGFQLEDIQLDHDSEKAIFVFPHSDKLRAYVSKYYSKELRIEPQSYNMSYRFLKNRLNEVLRKYGN